MFYRVAADPFYRIYINDFIEDMDSMMDSYHSELGNQNPENRITDNIPYVEFLDYLKEKPGWKMLINNVDSPLMRLLQLENLFFKKILVKQA